MLALVTMAVRSVSQRAGPLLGMQGLPVGWPVAAMERAVEAEEAAVTLAMWPWRWCCTWPLRSSQLMEPESMWELRIPSCLLVCVRACAVPFESIVLCVPLCVWVF